VFLTILTTLFVQHGYTYQNGRYIGNTGDEWADIPAIVGSFDLPHAVFAQSYAAKLSFMLQKHFKGRVHLQQAFLFINIFHMHIRKALQQRAPADAYDIEDELMKYRIIRYQPSNVESQEIWLFSILTYWMIFPEDDYTPASEIMTRAARYGAAVGRNLAHVDYEIAMFFNDHLFATLQRFLAKRKKQQQRKALFPPTIRPPRTSPFEFLTFLLVEPRSVRKLPPPESEASTVQGNEGLCTADGNAPIEEDIEIGES
jgi:hypothetical protein